MPADTSEPDRHARTGGSRAAGGRDAQSIQTAQSPCPVCGGRLEEVRQNLVCGRCRTICETCCEGGPET
jgi:hypothetical protein